MLKRRKAGDDALRVFLRDARGTFKHLCLLDANGCSPSQLCSGKTSHWVLVRFSLQPPYGFRALLTLDNGRCAGKCPYAVRQVCKGSSQPHRFALRALAQVLSTILVTGSLMLHVVPANGLAGSFQHKDCGERVSATGVENVLEIP